MRDSLTATRDNESSKGQCSYNRESSQNVEMMTTRAKVILVARMYTCLAVIYIVGNSTHFGTISPECPRYSPSFSQHGGSIAWKDHALFQYDLNCDTAPAVIPHPAWRLINNLQEYFKSVRIILLQKHGPLNISFVFPIKSGSQA